MNSIPYSLHFYICTSSIIIVQLLDLFAGLYEIKKNALYPAKLAVTFDWFFRNNEQNRSTLLAFLDSWGLGGSRDWKCEHSGSSQVDGFSSSWNRTKVCLEKFLISFSCGRSLLGCHPHLHWWQESSCLHKSIVHCLHCLEKIPFHSKQVQLILFLSRACSLDFWQTIFCCTENNSLHCLKIKFTFFCF